MAIKQGGMAGMGGGPRGPRPTGGGGVRTSSTRTSPRTGGKPAKKTTTAKYPNGLAKEVSFKKSVQTMGRKMGLGKAEGVKPKGKMAMAGTRKVKPVPKSVPNKTVKGSSSGSSITSAKNRYRMNQTQKGYDAKIKRMTGK